MSATARIFLSFGTVCSTMFLTAQCVSVAQLLHNAEVRENHGSALVQLSPKQASVPPLVLHQVSIGLDSATYRAVLQSPFLSPTFANAGERTTPHDANWTSFQLFGEEAMLELFNTERKTIPRGNAPSAYPKSGIVFAIEQEGGSAALLHALREKDSAFASTSASVLFPHKVGVSEIPTKQPTPKDTSTWWTSLTFSHYDESSSRFKSHIVEYHTQAYRHTITRRHYYASEYGAHKLIRGITSVCIALDSLETQRFLRVLHTSNYAVRAGKREIKADGHGTHFRIVPANESRQGVIEVRMKLNRSVAHQLYTFGENSTLMLDGDEAVWTF